MNNSINNMKLTYFYHLKVNYFPIRALTEMVYLCYNSNFVLIKEHIVHLVHYNICSLVLLRLIRLSCYRKTEEPSILKT